MDRMQLNWIGLDREDGVLRMGKYVRQGFKKPRAGLPALKRASLRRAMTEEKTGTAAEVPPERVGNPLTTTA